ncbi:NAD(P)/FAD-dependent oxidoreductase [Algoriphagus zhangzhouensis]|uniref:Pyridine nucleotide-disulphide oxidoreductase n=1 Tax=Algoriphagus zhangzhouensis TaxID=1073327 RepID=A0A1M7Z6P8_9BACT|nr:FAD/NAD(P)-binding oxidoreductase [Algoriphagus zhangzhouensis]TDY49148.1 pyridine nucleotide-disulfide oxidoreductase [Algoriphagus zhangzhouensis]SHO60502.1 Pyridine nucleotide-disulphide oxidoreductase [Algoriphagus zhangzhouensis]
MNPNRHILIIGNGIAGVTLARHIRKRDSSVKITLVSGESKYFFSRTALMYVFMGHMKFEHTQPYENFFWEKNRIDLKEGWVQSVDFDEKSLKLQSGESLFYDQLVIASGSKPNKFGWPGQDLKGVQGLYSKQDLELMEENTKEVKRAVIVGGGLIGIEMAEMLAYKKIPVTFLVRETSFWRNVLPKEESEMISKHVREHHIDLRLETELAEIIDDGNGKVKAVKTNHGEEIPCEFVGLTAGVTPNVDFLRNSKLEVNRGVVVNSKFETNIPDVYSIGDCAEFQVKPAADRKNIEQVWYTGRMHGETLALTLTGQATDYQAGVWFNSAKFLDVEYQTYGTVPADWKEEEFQSFYWEHPQKKVAFRMLMDTKGAIVGVNNFGFRLKHEFFDKAIKEKWTGQKVISSLRKANFDPEFFAPFYIEIQKAFLKEFGGDFKPEKRSFIQKLFGASV